MSNATDANYGATLSAQYAALAQQQNALNQLSSEIQSVRNVAALVYNQVDEQNDQLDALADDLEKGTQQVQRTSTNAANLTQTPYTLKTFCLFLWPLVLLIILLVQAILHWIF